MSERTVNHWEYRVFAFENTPEGLYDAACQYFMWCDTHPVYKPELIKVGSKCGTTVTAEMPRPYMIKGLCNFIGITEAYFNDMCFNENAGDWYHVANRIRNIIHLQKLENVMVGVYSPVIVTKELGLDKAQQGEGSLTVTIQVDGNAPQLEKDEIHIDMTRRDFSILIDEERDAKLIEDKKS